MQEVVINNIVPNCTLALVYHGMEIPCFTTLL